MSDMEIPKFEEDRFPPGVTEPWLWWQMPENIARSVQESADYEVNRDYGKEVQEIEGANGQGN